MRKKSKETLRVVKIEKLFARHSTRIYHFLIRFGIDESLAEDLLSELFLAAWRHASRYQGRSQVSTWLIAKSAADIAIGLGQYSMHVRAAGELIATIRSFTGRQ